MIPDEKRGRGLWYKRMREAHGYESAKQLLDAMAKHGIVIHQSQYAELEGHGKMDTRRSKEIAEQVAAFYGESLTSVAAPSEPGEGMAQLIAALTRQTDAMEALVKRLDSLASKAIQEGVADALREVALLQAAGVSQSGPPPEQRP